ncbi:MAG: ArsR family transcriptional regulator [Planctomycetota bacterium]|nr:MAG: ArsR family transcriptional regulator [Planctomycetota bacterium]
MPRPRSDHDVFIALADANRRRILDALSRSDADVSTITDICHASQPTVSEHLRILRSVGLVSVRRIGRRRVYHLVTEAITDASAWLARIARARPTPLADAPPDTSPAPAQPHQPTWDIDID